MSFTIFSCNNDDNPDKEVCIDSTIPCPVIIGQENKGCVVNIIFLAEGFTDSEMTEFMTLCDIAKQAILDMEPFTSAANSLNFYRVNSEVNAYESYTEFWAEIMNAIFCSYYATTNDNMNNFLSSCEFYINFERTYSLFQLVKTLDFMGLQYKDLYSNTKHSTIIRENLYKEKTNVLSYYIIKTIRRYNVIRKKIIVIRIKIRIFKNSRNIK
jgi:hypothetical protein